MPNHITNQITFGSDSASLAAFQKMLRDMRMEGQLLGSIDFNKLLPMSCNYEKTIISCFVHITFCCNCLWSRL